MSYFLFLILIIIVSLLLILVIMVQNPKDKSTWTLAIALFALILLSNFAIPRTNSVNVQSETEGIINDREVLDTPATLDTDKIIDSAN